MRTRQQVYWWRETYSDCNPPQHVLWDLLEHIQWTTCQKENDLWPFLETHQRLKTKFRHDSFFSLRYLLMTRAQSSASNCLLINIDASCKTHPFLKSSKLKNTADFYWTQSCVTETRQQLLKFSESYQRLEARRAEATRRQMCETWESLQGHALGRHTNPKTKRKKNTQHTAHVRRPAHRCTQVNIDHTLVAFSTHAKQHARSIFFFGWLGGGSVGVQKCKWLQGGERRFPKVPPEHKQHRNKRTCTENSPSINSVHIEILFSTKKAPKKVMM